MVQASYISVILPLKLEWEPCYSLPEEISRESVRTGCRVNVMFANRKYLGVVSGTDVKPETAPEKIRPILSVEEEMEQILPEEIDLWRKVAGYYLCSIGEVYKAAYPYGKTSMEQARAKALTKVKEKKERLVESIQGKIAKLETRLEKKREMISKARKDSSREAYIKDAERLQEELDLAMAALKSTYAGQTPEDSPQSSQTDPEICLTAAQNEAYDHIRKAFADGKPVLLNGVTGSGKTEIYMKLAGESLKRGRNVLYLVPEIALSRQLEDRLHSHFGEILMTFHSGVSAAGRRDVAESIRGMAGKKGNYIVLGTRSALFLPHHDLGLIIVDEEHDSSYKQDSPAPRYNGRDTALMLHQIQKCDIILGSATPSLEEQYNCLTGKHMMISLTERYHGSEDAEIEIIDTRAERRKRGMIGNFSRKLTDHINRTLQGGGQVILLRSRRSWAPAMQCTSCGEIVRCPHCNVSMSFHKNATSGRLTCHYCGYSVHHTGICTKCNGLLEGIGAGTQKIEEETKALFPDARVARLDSDTAQNKAYEAKVIRDFSNGGIDILIGTQMVTKGFDFKGLSLVAVIAADALFGMQDFRADEKAVQILEQFRGRCGRRESKGMFVIQTCQPEHPVYRKIVNGDTVSVSQDLMQERKEFNFPPFTRMVEVTVRDGNEERAQRMAGWLAERFRTEFHVAGTALLQSPVTGPYAPAVDKIADMYVRNIRISMKKDRFLNKNKERISQIVREFEKSYKYEGHITLNVDPS